MLALVLIIGFGSYALAAGWTQIFSHNLTITVEPIEVRVESVSNLRVYPDQWVEIVYKITNHSAQTYYNLTA